LFCLGPQQPRIHPVHREDTYAEQERQRDDEPGAPGGKCLQPNHSQGVNPAVLRWYNEYHNCNTGLQYTCHRPTKCLCRSAQGALHLSAGVYGPHLQANMTSIYTAAPLNSFQSLHEEATAHPAYS
jgi:hypothetical protein